MRTWRLATLALGAIMMLSISVGASAQGSYLDRTGGPSEDEMLARGDGGIEGLAFFRPVLSGVLYRAGFHGGDRDRTGLDDAQRSSLCQAGFSQARYVDFGKNTSYGETPCEAGGMNY